MAEKVKNDPKTPAPKQIPTDKINFGILMFIYLVYQKKQKNFVESKKPLSKFCYNSTALKTKKNYLPLIITGILFLLIYLIGLKIPEETIRNIMENAGIFGPVVLIFLIWITNVFAPLGAAPFLFAGFYLYGEMIIVFAVIASLLSAISNFWIAKIWGRKIVIKLLGMEDLEKIDRLTDNYGYQTLFIIRIFLSGFHDIISYVFGLTKIKFIPYFIISLIGMIPGTLLWYYLSSKIQNPFIFTILTLGIGYLLLSLYIIGIKFFKKEKQFSKPNR